MRDYLDESNKEIKEAICNQCGKALRVEAGIIKEGCFTVDFVWGYFSGRDGQRHKFDLCEECYCRLLNTFQIPPRISEENEIL